MSDARIPEAAAPRISEAGESASAVGVYAMNDGSGKVRLVARSALGMVPGSMQQAAAVLESSVAHGPGPGTAAGPARLGVI